jgi:hypothetical protein
MSILTEPVGWMEDLNFRAWARADPAMQRLPPSYGSAAHETLRQTINFNWLLLSARIRSSTDRNRDETSSDILTALFKIAQCKAILSPARALNQDILAHIFSIFTRERYWFVPKNVLR